MMPVMIFSLAVAQGNQVIVGWRVGAKDYKDAYERTLKTVRLAFIFVIFASSFMYFNSGWLLGLFTDNPVIIEMGQRAMLIGIFLEMGRMANLVVIQALRASGDVIFPVIIAIISMLSAMIGLSYLFGIHLGYGLAGIFIGLAADECLRAILVMIRWLRGKWKDKRVTS
jgi:Na+-driven multidrug efflux pump